MHLALPGVPLDRRPCLRLSDYGLHPAADPNILKGGGAERQFIMQLRPHLSQMRTTT